MKRQQIAYKTLFLLVFTACTFLNSHANAKPIDSTHQLIIQSAQEKHLFNIEIADSPDEWEKGLMFRKELEQYKGMLFIFPTQEIAQFWMKNTLIPLDMLFIDRAGKIIKIAKNATPKSLAVISSGQPVKAVLEVLGGTSDKLKLKTDDRVIHAIFKSR